MNHNVTSLDYDIHCFFCTLYYLIPFDGNNTLGNTVGARFGRSEIVLQLQCNFRPTDGAKVFSHTLQLKFCFYQITSYT